MSQPQLPKSAPDFSLPDQTGQVKTLADYAGKWLVLYFYPKDNTPGCTTEACNFRDARDSLKTIGQVEVVGVSKDSVRKHASFIAKHKLNFTLLSDPEAVAIKSYESWGPKKLFGHEYLGILRNTFIINPSGQIVKEYLGVDPSAHAAQILTDLQQLKS